MVAIILDSFILDPEKVTYVVKLGTDETKGAIQFHDGTSITWTVDEQRTVATVGEAIVLEGERQRSTGDLRSMLGVDK
jgi:hypothetical protein